MLVRLSLSVTLLALVVRVMVVLLTPIGSEDMVGWVAATRHLADHGLGTIYAETLRGNLYPPAFFLPLWAIGAGVRALGGAGALADDAALSLVLRLYGVLLDGALAVVVMRIAASVAGGRAALAAGLLYALNPAVLLNVAWASQIGDPLYVLLLALGFIAIIGGRVPAGAGILVAAALVKPQALALLLLGALVILTRSRPRTIFMSLGVATSVIVVAGAPFALAGTLGDALATLANMGSLFPFVQVRAHNVWFLASGGADPWGELPTLWRGVGASDLRLLLGVVTLRDVGLAAFLAVYGVVAALLLGRSGRVGLVAATAVLTGAFFMLCTRMHVNYLYPTLVAVTVLAAARPRTFGPILAGLTASSVTNWLVSSDVVTGVSLRALQAVGAASSLLAAGCFLVLFVAAVREIRREHIVADSLAADLRHVMAAILVAVLGGLGGLTWLAVAGPGVGLSLLTLAGAITLISVGVLVAGRWRLARLLAVQHPPPVPHAASTA